MCKNIKKDSNMLLHKIAIQLLASWKVNYLKIWSNKDALDVLQYLKYTKNQKKNIKKERRKCYNSFKLYIFFLVNENNFGY